MSSYFHAWIFSLLPSLDLSPEVVLDSVKGLRVFFKTALVILESFYAYLHAQKVSVVTQNDFFEYTGLTFHVKKEGTNGYIYTFVSFSLPTPLWV